MYPAKKMDTNYDVHDIGIADGKFIKLLLSWPWPPLVPFQKLHRIS